MRESMYFEPESWGNGIKATKAAHHILAHTHTHTDYIFMHNLFAYNRGDTRITVEYCSPDKIYGRNAGEIDKRQ